MSSDSSIRMATELDTEEILSIYAPYVLDTAITFEYEIPSLEEFSQRIRDTLKSYPYLVALEENRITGYAYASAFHKRAAYQWSAETTVYLKQDCRGKGLGKQLYYELESILKSQNIINVNACIAYVQGEDQHLNNASVAFHERMGYSKVAHFKKCGYKFGTWYDMIWMEKMLREHPDAPEPLLPITKIHYY